MSAMAMLRQSSRRSNPESVVDETRHFNLSVVNGLMNVHAGMLSWLINVVAHTDNGGTLASKVDLSNRRGDALVKVLTTPIR